MNKLNFFATYPHYADHMIPIYQAMGDKAGEFFVSQEIAKHVWQRGVLPVIDVAPISLDPMLVASHNDLRLAYLIDPHRHYVLMEHGVGLVFPNNPSYAGGFGRRGKVTLTLAPNSFVYGLTAKAYPDMWQEIVGTPKMDAWAQTYLDSASAYRDFAEDGFSPKKPTVAVTFHWDGSVVAPEAGTAFDYFKEVLPALHGRSDMILIAHVHPKSSQEVHQFFWRHKIPLVKSLEDVFKFADILVNDCSSILYEFLVTGKPVILLNSPNFRRDVDFGPRFWRYTDIGEHVNAPRELESAIRRAWKVLPDYESGRNKAVRDLYPYLGKSAKQAVSILRALL